MNNQFIKSQNNDPHLVCKHGCSTKPCIHHFSVFSHTMRNQMLSFKAQVTCSLTLTPPSPLPSPPPCGMLGWRVLWLHHPKLWQVAVTWTPPSPQPLLYPRSAGWLTGLPVDPPFFSPCRLLLLVCKNFIVNFIHILFVTRFKTDDLKPILTLNYFSSVSSAPLCTLGDFSSLSRLAHRITSLWQSHWNW